MEALLNLSVSATRVARVWWAAALLVSLSGCAGMRSLGAADRSTVHVSVEARDCRTPSETGRPSDAPPKLERVARAAAGGVVGGLGGAVGGAAASFLFVVWALAPACVEPTTCGAGIVTIVTVGAVAGGVFGAVQGARNAWRESSGVAPNSHACTTGPEIRSYGHSSSGEAEAPDETRSTLAS